MSKRYIRNLVLLFAAVPLFAVFQNCSAHQFSSTDATSASVTDSGEPTGDPATPTQVVASTPIPLPTPVVPVVCDPFSAGSTCSASAGGPGLLGNLYFLSNGQTLNAYFTQGVKQNILIILSQLDVPTRDFATGFPGPSGPLMNGNGEILTEWFALDLTGNIKLNNEPEGSYQFAFISDDGSALAIDGHQIINNDGLHGPTWKCGTTAVALSRTVKHAIRVGYFQGPKVQIALQLFWRPYSANSANCDQQSSDWQVVPADVFSH